MGTWCCSMHFMTDEPARIHAAARFGRLAPTLIASAPVGRWVPAFPTMQAIDQVNEHTGQIARAAKVEHALGLTLADSDVFCYWYYHNGVLADSFISAPDYFGDATDEELAAAGSPDVFRTLLADPADHGALARLLAPRMINGKTVGGDAPVFEDLRLEEFGRLLGLSGVLGSYDFLKDGEEVDGVGMLADCVEVG